MVQTIRVLAPRKWPVEIKRKKQYALPPKRAHAAGRSSAPLENCEWNRRRRPGPEAGALVLAYDFGLQALAVASHIPPALVQADLVLAVVTSAARLGAVKATAMPKATIADTNFFMGYISSVREAAVG